MFGMVVAKQSDCKKYSYFIYFVTCLNSCFALFLYSEAAVFASLKTKNMAFYFFF